MIIYSEMINLQLLFTTLVICTFSKRIFEPSPFSGGVSTPRDNPTKLDLRDIMPFELYNSYINYKSRSFAEKKALDIDKFTCKASDSTIEPKPEYVAPYTISYENFRGNSGGNSFRNRFGKVAPQSFAQDTFRRETFNKNVKKINDNNRNSQRKYTMKLN